MKIAVVDADLAHNKKHRFPNLACMKISSYHKRLGHQVELKLDYDDLDKYDKIYISKVFTEIYGVEITVPHDVLLKKNVTYGGTGFFYENSPKLPYEIEHSKPDYSLYSEWVEMMIESGEKKKSFEYYTDYSIGFTTRGCIRGCEFCVNKNYKQSKLHSPLEEFVDFNRPKICLLDDNVLACKDWKEIFDRLIELKMPFQYKQGLDERLLTKEKIDYIFNKSKWIGDFIFAFDNIKDKDIIERKLNLIKENTNNKRVKKFYVFCCFNHEDPHVYDDEFWAKDILDIFKRIEILMKYQSLPYIMRYKDYTLSPYKGMYITIARWCNQPSFFKKKSFREFCYAHSSKSDKTPAPIRYMEEFEDKYKKEIGNYFDMKFEEFEGGINVKLDN